MSNSLLLIDKTLSDATNLSQGGPRNNGNEKVLHIPPNNKPGAPVSDSLVSYLGHLMVLGIIYLQICCRCILRHCSKRSI